MKFAQEALDKRGGAQRINKNMLVFLAADSKRLEELMDSVRSFLSWQSIVSRIEELNLSPQQAKQAQDRQAEANEAADSRIGQTYIHGILPEQPEASQPIIWSVEKCDGQESNLAIRTSTRLERAGLLTDVSAPQTIRLDLDSKLSRAWESGHITVGTLWSYYAQYPYLTRMKNRDVLVSAVRDTVSQFTWESEGFTLANSFDSSTGRYEGLLIPGAGTVAGAITDSVILVKPSVALLQTPETVDTRVVDPDDGSTTTVAHPGELSPDPVAIQNTHYFGVYELNPEKYARDLTKVSQEILQHLASAEGVELVIAVEIQAKKLDGFSEDKMRVILENARSLKFKQSGFSSD